MAVREIEAQDKRLGDSRSYCAFKNLFQKVPGKKFHFLKGTKLFFQILPKFGPFLTVFGVKLAKIGTILSRNGLFPDLCSQCIDA